jgi:hypothetical protein
MQKYFSRHLCIHACRKGNGARNVKHKADMAWEEERGEGYIEGENKRYQISLFFTPPVAVFSHLYILRQ